MSAYSLESSQVVALGIEAFDALRTETEPWLAQVFEAPPEFDLVSGPRSCVIFGAAGSGRSAVYQALLHSFAANGPASKRLIAEWRPRIPDDPDEPGVRLVKRQIAEMFDTCAFSTVRYLTQQPELLATAPSWAQRTLHWFIQRHLRGDFEMRTGVLQRQLNEGGYKVLEQLMQRPERELFVGEAAPEEIIAQLVAALAEVQLQGVWVLIDQDDVSAEELGRVTAGLRAFLSRLNLFEQKGFTYKIFLPVTLRSQLSNVSGIERRRLSVHYLEWTQEKLAALLVKRMALAIGRDIQQLAQICDDAQLLRWMERCGGMKPRGWLEQFRPLAAAYLERYRRGQTMPISAEEWRAIRQRHPPRLAFNREQKKVWVEEREVELTDEQFKIFNYLYDHPGEVCTRSQLYYLAYRGLNHEARSHTDDGYELPANYRGLIETAIWRLRQNIEPDDKQETFIITVKGRGYRLDHT